MARIITVRGIVEKEGKLLCFKLKLHTGEVADFWSIPGGKLEPNESLLDGLVREFIEETGVKPKIGRLVLIQQFMNPREDEQLEFFFMIDNPDDFLDLDLSKASHAEDEISESAFIDPKTSYVLPKILSEVDVRSINTPIIVDCLNERLNTD